LKPESEITIALLGAGGKMGLRTADNLRKTQYNVRHAEIAERGKAALAERGLSAMTPEEAIDGADVTILALPDNRIGQISEALGDKFRAGSMLIALDVAAPIAGHLPKRDDLTFFVSHPCHPSVFGNETDPDAQNDFFGGIHAMQHIVCGLAQGPEEDYALGEAIARAMYAPVGMSHRCTAEQMAILEPVLSETVTATCLVVIGEAIDEAVRRGVPEAAARDFILGHIKVELGIVFKLFPGATFSDGAKRAIEDAKRTIFQPDWKRVFEPESIAQSIRNITTPPGA
jgi:hypothetical protein